MNKNPECEEFWNWFARTADTLAANPTDPSLVRELDQRVLAIDASLSWELGPGITAEWCLTVSPGMDCDLVPLAKSVIDGAPKLNGWEFRSFKQPKLWDLRFEILRGDERILVNASAWRFVLLRYDDGAAEILICTNQPWPVGNAVRQEAALILLEGELGEEWLLNPDLSFELVEEVEPEFHAKLRPIRELRSAFCVRATNG